MTAPETRPESAVEATAGPDLGQDQGPDKVSRYDARIRGKLREAEVERDALRGQVAAMVDAEVSRLLAGRVSDVATALRASGKAPGDFVDESGLVDSRGVDEWAESFLTANPGFRLGPPKVDGRGQHRVSGDEVVSGQRPKATWSDLFRARSSSSTAE